MRSVGNINISTNLDYSFNILIDYRLACVVFLTFSLILYYEPLPEDDAYIISDQCYSTCAVIQ